VIIFCNQLQLITISEMITNLLETNHNLLQKCLTGKKQILSVKLSVVAVLVHTGICPCVRMSDSLLEFWVVRSDNAENAIRITYVVNTDTNDNTA